MANQLSSKTKNEHLKRLGRLLEAIEYAPERIVKKHQEPLHGKKNGKALKVKAYCLSFVDRGLTATASLTLSSFRSFLTSQEITMA